MKFNILVVCVLIFLKSSCSQYNSRATYSGARNLENKISLGLIFDHNFELLSKTFEYAISEANTGLNLPLEGIVKETGAGNSLVAYRELCNLMEEGVATVFGCLSKQTSEHISHFCDHKDMPFILTNTKANTNGLNLHPHWLDLAEVIYKIVEAFEWTRFFYLYETTEDLKLLNKIISLNATEGPVITALRYDIQMNGDYKVVLRKVRDSKDAKVVIVGSTPSLISLLTQAVKVGIMMEEYHYIIVNLDFHTFNQDEYKHSGANITSLRMFSTEQDLVKNLMTALNFETENLPKGYCPITMEMALIYDAVQIFANSTNHLIYQPQSVNCSEKSDIVRSDGLTFNNYMKSQVFLKEKTLTGKIFFEGNVRKGYSLDIIEMHSTGILKIGVWTEDKFLEIKREPMPIETEDIDENSLVNKTFTILIASNNKPYADLVESHTALVGNDQYEGYAIDVIKLLAEKLHFNYKFVNGGSLYGNYNKTTNTSTGYLKEIAEGRAHLAITDLTITAERQEVVDFTVPFMNLGIAILYVKPQVAPPALFAFMDPFSKEVWWFLGAAFLGVSLSLFILGRLSPAEWDNPYPCIDDPEDLENQFTIGNCLWFSTGALLQQGSEIAPKALSTRTMASIWWFYTLIIVSSYTANLAAFLTVVKPTGLIENVMDLSENRGGVQYGAKKTGSTRDFFLTSNDPVYVKMNEYMVNNPDLLVDDNGKGVARVDEKYAFLMESTSIEYNIVRNCKLTMIGQPLDEKGYGIAMKKSWIYYDQFNYAVLELQESGTLANLKNKWWKEIGAKVCNDDSSGDAPSLTIENVKGVFLVLLVGSVLSVLFGIAHLFSNVARRVKREKIPFKTAFIEEFKVVVNFCNNERVLMDGSSSANSVLSENSFEIEEKSLSQQ